MPTPETDSTALTASHRELSHMTGRRGLSGSSAPISAITMAEDEFCFLLDSAGMLRGLAMLNARTRYRFTGVYRVVPPDLRNEDLFDRENPTLSLGGDVTPLDNTYCGIVAATATPFLAIDSRSDPRLEKHPGRDSVVSYIGVPVRDSHGRTVGTLCHFDVRPRILPLDELALLESISCQVSAWFARNSPHTT